MKNMFQETMASLREDSRKVVDMATTGSRQIFEECGNVHPVVFHMPLHGDKILYTEIPVLDDNTKPAIWAAIRALRRTMPVVVFVSECWTAMASKDKPLDMSVMPRDNPDRKEVLMVTLWEGSRNVIFYADITHNPDQLGEWDCFYDSAFPRENGADSIGGALADGEPCILEGN